MAFDGTWKVEKNENYEKFMEAMGISLMKRKLGSHDNLKVTIHQEGNKFTVKESSNFRTIEIVFILGEDFDYSLADGTELHGNWNLEGNKLVGSFIRKDNGKELKALREIVGDEMIQLQTQACQVSTFGQDIHGFCSLSPELSSIYYCSRNLLDSEWALTTVLGGKSYSLSSGQRAIKEKTYTYEGVTAKRIFKKA